MHIDFRSVINNVVVNAAAEPPRVLTQNNKVYQVIKNRQASIDCASFGSPIPKITW